MITLYISDILFLLLLLPATNLIAAGRSTATNPFDLVGKSCYFASIYFFASIILFFPSFFFSMENQFIHLLIRLFITSDPHHRRKLSMISILFASLFPFRASLPPPPSSSLVGVFLFRGAAVSPTSILKIARIIRRIPRSNVIIVINPVVLSNE